MTIFEFIEELAKELLINGDYMVNWITDYANWYNTNHWEKSKLLTAHLCFNRWHLITDIETLIDSMSQKVNETNTNWEKADLYFYTKFYHKKVEVWVEINY